MLSSNLVEPQNPMPDQADLWNFDLNDSSTSLPSSNPPLSSDLIASTEYQQPAATEQKQEQQITSLGDDYLIPSSIAPSIVNSDTTHDVTVPIVGAVGSANGMPETMITSNSVYEAPLPAMKLEPDQNIAQSSRAVDSVYDVLPPIEKREPSYNTMPQIGEIGSVHDVVPSVVKPEFIYNMAPPTRGIDSTYDMIPPMMKQELIVPPTTKLDSMSEVTSPLNTSNQHESMTSQPIGAKPAHEIDNRNSNNTSTSKQSQKPNPDVPASPTVSKSGSRIKAFSLKRQKSKPEIEKRISCIEGSSEVSNG